MKKIYNLIFICLILFIGCNKKPIENQSLESIESINNFTETEILTDEATKETEVADESSITEIVPLKAIENIELYETVELVMEQETELLKTDDFTISILAKELQSGKDSDSYKCELYVTDSQGDKSFLDDCQIRCIGQIDNPIVCYDVLDKENPLVCADINNNKITDYLFILNGSNSDVLIGFEKKNEKYVSILNNPVQTDGGPEVDIFAENIIFNYGKNHDEIIIDSSPYNWRSHLSFDINSYKYILMNESPYTLQEYFPKESLDVKQIGTHEIAVSDQRIYLKEKDSYYKICFLGDPETYGDLFINNNIGLQGIKILDIDESSFVVHLAFNHYHNNQFYLIFHKNGELYINKTEEIQDCKPGIFCDDGEILDMQSAVKENGGVTITYNVLEHYRDSDEDKLLDTRTTYIKSENLD